MAKAINKKIAIIIELELHEICSRHATFENGFFLYFILGVVSIRGEPLINIVREHIP